MLIKDGKKPVEWAYPPNPKCRKHEDVTMLYVGSLPWRENPESIIYECPENSCTVQAEVNLEEGKITWR